MLKPIGKALGIIFLVLITVIVFLAFKPINPTTPSLQPRDNTQYWNMSGGYKIAYAHLESKTKPAKMPVIFLHGGPGGYVHSSLFDTLGPLTDAGYDVFLYDQSGTGLSDRRARPKDTTFDSHVSDLREIIMAHIGAERAALIGHSNGGNIAARFATHHPDQTAGLILSAPGDIFPPVFDDEGKWVNERLYPVPEKYEFKDTSQTYLKDTSARNLPFRAIASITAATLFNVRFAPDKEVDAALNTLAANFTHNMVCDPANVKPEEGGGGGYSRAGANFYPDDFKGHRDKMPNMKQPVIVLHGQCDFIPYAAVYEYVDQFPNADYKFIEGAGHIIYWDQPDQYRTIIQEFLRLL